jgi:spore coat protein W
MGKSNEQENSKQSVKSNSLAIADLLVADVFRKNNIDLGKIKNELSNDKKQMIRNVVNDLTKQVNDYIDKNPKKDKK